MSRAKVENFWTVAKSFKRDFRASPESAQPILLDKEKVPKWSSNFVDASSPDRGEGLPDTICASDEQGWSPQINVTLSEDRVNADNPMVWRDRPRKGGASFCVTYSPA